jgi:hypothetical protein
LVEGDPFPHKKSETSVPGCDEDNFGKLANAKSIIRDMLHTTNIQHTRGKKKCSEDSEATVGLDVEIQIAKIAKDRFPKAPIHANADISLYSTEKPEAKGLEERRPCRRQV